MTSEILRNIPPVHELQRDRNFTILKKRYDVKEEVITNELRAILLILRQRILAGNWSEVAVMPFIWEMLDDRMKEKMKAKLRKVINATGTVLHTNLGRSRLSKAAIDRIVEAASSYTNLEYQIETGQRGSRHDIVESIIKEVTGAEAAMVVNNNAAAVYLVLKALAKEREVIVSRGQLVEIGGAFRISSIMEESGATLVEVGTTNKTHLKDYMEAITEHTAMLLKVHTSNFKTIGFTKTVSTEELVSIKNQHKDLIVYEDLGSGVLYDFSKHGIGEEPVVQQVIGAGVDIVSFSGDKLLGGPQAGIIAGKRECIDRLKKHQLARVLRVDKMSFAALEATFQAYRNKKIHQIPTVRDLLRKTEEIKEQAELFIHELASNVSIQSELDKDDSVVGGGTMPDVRIPTYVVKLSHHHLSAQRLADLLRKSDPCIIVRTSNNHVLLDFRTIEQGEIPDILEAIKHIDATYHD